MKRGGLVKKRRTIELPSSSTPIVGFPRPRGAVSPFNATASNVAAQATLPIAGVNVAIPTNFEPARITPLILGLEPVARRNDLGTLIAVPVQVPGTLQVAQIIS